MQIIKDQITAIHEASHAVVAKLFEDKLYLKHITISPEKIKEVITNDKDTYGLIGVEPKLQDLSCVGFVLLAGIIGEQILDGGPAKIISEKEISVSSPEKMVSILGGGDLLYFMDCDKTFGWKYGADSQGFRKACFNFLIDFLCDDRVWKIVEDLSKEVINKDNKTIEADELSAFFQTSGFDDYLKENKERLLKLTEPNIDPNSEEELLKTLGVSADSVNIFPECDDKAGDKPATTKA